MVSPAIIWVGLLLLQSDLVIWIKCFRLYLCHVYMHSLPLKHNNHIKAKKGKIWNKGKKQSEYSTNYLHNPGADIHVALFRLWLESITTIVKGAICKKKNYIWVLWNKRKKFGITANRYYNPKLSVFDMFGMRFKNELFWQIGALTHSQNSPITQ